MPTSDDFFTRDHRRQRFHAEYSIEADLQSIENSDDLILNRMDASQSTRIADGSKKHIVVPVRLGR